MIKRRTREILIFSLFFIAVFSYSYRVHRNTGYFTWKSEITSDKAGYYCYLPATFYFHFNPKEFPEGIDRETGYGFILDTVKGKVYSKYTYGVAALVSPFFLGVHCISWVFHLPRDGGFSPLYRKAINLAAVFYLVLGLWLLKRFLENYLKEGVIYLALVLMVLGTNLLYYSTTESLMSHVYSFFLFSLALFALAKFYTGRKKFGWFLLAGFSISLIILIRPINIIILPFLLLWDFKSGISLADRIRLAWKPGYVIAFLVILFLVFLPQLIYWKYLTGNYIFYSYGNEGFTNWNHPRILEVWFSTLNGLFLYNPLVLVFVAGMILMIVKKEVNGILLLVLFFLLTYGIASWSCWYFGCSFGQRSFVEYFSFFSLPFGFILERTFTAKRNLRKGLPLLLFIMLTGVNILLMSVYDRCFLGSTWDWREFERLIGKTGRPYRFRYVKGFSNDLENGIISAPYILSDSIRRSGTYSIILVPGSPPCCMHSLPLWETGNSGPSRVDVDFWIRKTEDPPFKIHIACTVFKNDSSVVWKSEETRFLLMKAGAWFNTGKEFLLPENFPRNYQLAVYVRNEDTKKCFLDDITIKYR